MSGISILTFNKLTGQSALKAPSAGPRFLLRFGWLSLNPLWGFWMAAMPKLRLCQKAEPAVAWQLFEPAPKREPFMMLQDKGTAPALHFNDERLKNWRAPLQ